MQLPEDPIILEMLPDFVESWRRDISTKLEPIIASRDESELYRFGHTLKGSGRQFNLNEIADLGGQLQEAAKGHKWEEALALKQTILEAIEIAQNFLIENHIFAADKFSELPTNI